MDGKHIIAFVLGVMATSYADKPSLNKLQAKLNELKNSAPITSHSLVTCYEAIRQESRAVYTCPVCKKQTVYELEDTKLAVISQIPPSEIIKTLSSIDHYRTDVPRRLKELAKDYKLRFSFDESGFCEHCSPSGKPQLILKVTHPDDKIVSTPFKLRDISLLNAFFKNEKTFFDGPGESKNLKDEAKRIAELLGLSL